MSKILLLNFHTFIWTHFQLVTLSSCHSCLSFKTGLFSLQIEVQCHICLSLKTLLDSFCFGVIYPLPPGCQNVLSSELKKLLFGDKSQMILIQITWKDRYVSHVFRFEGDNIWTVNKSWFVMGVGVGGALWTSHTCMSFLSQPWNSQTLFASSECS